MLIHVKRRVVVLQAGQTRHDGAKPREEEERKGLVYVSCAIVQILVGDVYEQSIREMSGYIVKVLIKLGTELEVLTTEGCGTIRFWTAHESAVPLLRAIFLGSLGIARPRCFT